LGRIEVGGDGVAGAENGAGCEMADGLGQLVEERLVPEAPVVGLVGYAGDFFPGCAPVEASVNGEVDKRGFGAVVFLCWW
jgi:hypothetical protein